MSPYDAPLADHLIETTGGALAERYRRVRAESLARAAPLGPEDMAAQSMPDASPIKWHLAHSTWFFETFVLLSSGRSRFDERFAYLFNSYYEALGARQPRPHRGLITRPTCEEVMTYRRHVDSEMSALMSRVDPTPEFLALMELGLAHEQQHQELMLTDVLHLFAQNALHPVYDLYLAQDAPCGGGDEPIRFEGGVVEIGHDGQGFAFDNEGPRHRILLQPFGLAKGLVTNGEWRRFMAEGGYERSEFWLSDGWQMAGDQGWRAPLYWDADNEGAFGLGGMRPISDTAPVRHVSFYEADAFARWAGARLPLEAEWEYAAQTADAAFDGLFDQVWQWTASPYVAYPGFRTSPGAVGEYNGKFMINQMILRGSSVATPPGHTRSTYRNFFQPHQRWQFSGLRLAYD